MTFEEEVAFWKLAGTGSLENKSLEGIYNLNLATFLLNAKQPFLICSSSENTRDASSSLEFIVRRSDSIQPFFR